MYILIERCTCKYSDKKKAHKYISGPFSKTNNLFFTLPPLNNSFSSANTFTESKAVLYYIYNLQDFVLLKEQISRMRRSSCIYS